jgi:hypothetical protein
MSHGNETLAPDGAKARAKAAMPAKGEASRGVNGGNDGALNHEDDGSRGLDPNAWPDAMDAAAFHGLAGEIVMALDEHTEADPAAVLSQLLALFGNVIGRKPFYLVEATKHATNLFAVLIGKTARARKGTALDRVKEIFAMVDPDWTRLRIHSGLGSGEGLIWSVRDAAEVEPGPDNSKPRDGGVADKRMMLVEPEFPGLLRVMQRQGNTISKLLREAWDSGDLQTVTKQAPCRATGAMVSVVGHATPYELTDTLDRTEMGNGFANRFLFICCTRSKELPFGGEALDPNLLGRFADRIRAAVEHARGRERIEFTDAARRVWPAIYSALTGDRPGMLGAVTARAEAQVCRLALIYALLDEADAIDVPHLEAAVAVWEYSEASAAYVFGGSSGDPTAQKILDALTGAGAAGLTLTAIHNLFSRNKDAAQIGRALGLLANSGKARCPNQAGASGKGRAAEVWIATAGEP